MSVKVDPRSKLNEEQVRIILTSNETHMALSAIIGVSKTTISNVRHGKQLSKVLPHLPRWETLKETNPGASCAKCRFFEKKDDTPRCDIGIPEFTGTRINRPCYTFAKFCGMYLEAAAE